MHTDVGITGPALDMLTEVFRGPLAAYPDSGFFEMPHWNFTDVIAPATLATYATTWASQGVRIIGGCCGLGPDKVTNPRYFKSYIKSLEGFFCRTGEVEWYLAFF